jgi:hypothetical protein
MQCALVDVPTVRQIPPAFEHERTSLQSPGTRDFPPSSALSRETGRAFMALSAGCRWHSVQLSGCPSHLRPPSSRSPSSRICQAKASKRVLEPAHLPGDAAHERAPHNLGRFQGHPADIAQHRYRIFLSKACPTIARDCRPKCRTAYPTSRANAQVWKVSE